VLLDGAHKGRARRAYLRVGVERDADGQPTRDDAGRLQARVAGGQGSHVLSTLAATEALAIVPESVDEATPGMEVDLMWLDPIA
jgi:molybdopterin molybdotransferase